MTRQAGIIPLRGTIDNIIFYYSKTGGYIARRKGNVDAQRIASDPAFRRTRENSTEFGRASKAGRLVRMCFRSLMQNASDSIAAGRLVQVFSKVIKTDVINERGQRNVTDGELELLTGFEFNADSKLERMLLASYSTDIDRAGGTMTLHVPAFIPKEMIAAPAGATHFVISCGGAEIDFEAGNYVNGFAWSNELPINSEATSALHLTVSVTAGSIKPLFMVMGIRFIQLVNGVSYDLKDGVCNALAVAGVS
ncbi:hypothetical protein [Chitinophaga tropicalis]|uniref:Uncharacterized protein n=1 Tax=Chitinophaga tropicalis TaxID=2683588 RepID=A0A7K1U8A5_9BACT|nr:hypothetical protein [Chitinophaga tropicalis]MVT10546.1 hypothetical protein [Chitinophaga tropicalis]